MGEEKKQLVAEAKEKGNSAVISALITGIACLGIGIAVGMFLPKDATPAVNNNEPEKTDDNAKEVEVVSMDDETRKKIDVKLDAYESAFVYGLGLRPFHISSLNPYIKLEAALATMKNDELAELDAAFKNSKTYESTISLEKVEAAYKALYGEDLPEAGRVDVPVCNHAIPGGFTYDSDKKEYKISLPQGIGCGGTTDTIYDSYRDDYSIKGDKAYVTIEVGRMQYGISAGSNQVEGVFSDIIDGDLVSSSVLQGSDFVTESNKNSFTQYQYILDKHDGEWVLRGLYPLGAE